LVVPGAPEVSEGAAALEVVDRRPVYLESTRETAEPEQKEVQVVAVVSAQEAASISRTAW
jgi:hypothetical protein